MTDRREFLLSMAREPDERIFIGKAIDTAERASWRNCPQITEFFDPGGLQLARSVASGLGLKILADGGYSHAERKRAVFIPQAFSWFDDDFELDVVRIIPRKKEVALQHRNCLGAILGLGLRRDVIGDVIVQGEQSFAVVVRDISSFVANNLSKIGSEAVTCQVLDTAALQGIEPEPYELRSVTTASLRVDGIVAKAFNLSRGKAQDLFQAGRVRLNFRLAVSSSAEVCENDIISCRGYGRCKVLAVEGVTKKGRVRLTLGLPK